MSTKTCFLCKTVLNKSNRSAEHVFDNALLKRYGLHKNEVRLPNGTYLEYGKQKIPCCIDCNGNKLRPVWDRVNTAIDSGKESIKALNRSDLFVWLAKIYYGLHVRDSVIDMDKNSPGGGRIATQELLDSNELLVYMINQILNPVEKTAALPYSLFFFDCENPVEEGERFWFTDSRSHAFIAIKLSDIMVVAFLHDFGTVSELEMSHPITEVDRKALKDGAVSSFLLPKLATKIKLSYMQALELGAFYQTLAMHLFPVEVRVTHRGNVVWRFIGERAYKDAPPIRGWDTDLHRQVKGRLLGEEVCQEGERISGSPDFSLIYSPGAYDYSNY